MDGIQQAIKDLNVAKKAIDKALASLELLNESPAQNEVGVCLFCKKPIFDTDEVTREIHRACYDSAAYKVKTNETTFEELESLGLIGPKGKSGRKPSIEAGGIIAIARAQIDADEGE